MISNFNPRQFILSVDANLLEEAADTAIECANMLPDFGDLEHKAKLVAIYTQQAKNLTRLRRQLLDQQSYCKELSYLRSRIRTEKYARAEAQEACKYWEDRALAAEAKNAGGGL
jgi:hypothetical protein